VTLLAPGSWPAGSEAVHDAARWNVSPDDDMGRNGSEQRRRLAQGGARERSTAGAGRRRSNRVRR